jgi:hypothetical protein
VFCGGAPAAQQLEQPRRARPPPPHAWPCLDLRMKTASGGELDRASSPALGDASPSPAAAGGAPGGGPCFFSLFRRWWRGGCGGVRRSALVTALPSDDNYDSSASSVCKVSLGGGVAGRVVGPSQPGRGPPSH